MTNQEKLMQLNGIKSLKKGDDETRMKEMESTLDDLILLMADLIGGQNENTEYFET